MTDFDKAIEFVMAHEGGFVDDPTDAGGTTNWGISLRFLENVGDTDEDGWLDGDIDHDGDVDSDDIRQMTREQAVQIYKRQFWERYRYGRLADQALATKVLDLSVNMGPGRAHRLLQQALLAMGLPITVDGKLGPATLATVRSACHEHRDRLMILLVREQAFFYARITQRRPANVKFLYGWMRRAFALPGVAD